MDTPIVPRPGFALVELGQAYENINISTRAYEQASKGKCLAIGGGGERHTELLGRVVYWSAGVAPAPITKDGKDYVFIRINQIEGYDNNASKN